MDTRWSTDERSGIHVFIPATIVPLILLAGIAIAYGVLDMRASNRALEADVARLSSEQARGAEREHDLELSVVRKHDQLRQAEGELEMVRLQIEALEMQLDGIDFLSRELRAELGLPPSAATWSDHPEDGTPVGGSYGPADPNRERLDLLQRRLAAGLAEMYALRDHSRARRAGEGADGSGLGGAVEPAVEPAPAVVAPPANWPARGGVTSRFGWRVFRGRPSYHTGIDVAMPYGTLVLATGHGTVVGSGWQPGYGWSVFVQHDEGFNTLFAHLSDALVEVGDVVEPGGAIGLSGSSGNSTGPHLHYEIWKDGRPLDPRPFMDGTGPE